MPVIVHACNSATSIIAINELTCDETVISADWVSEISGATAPLLTISNLFSSHTARLDRQATASRNTSTSSDANNFVNGASAPSVQRTRATLICLNESRHCMHHLLDFAVG
jgi:hypothetical protein